MSAFEHQLEEALTARTDAKESAIFHQDGFWWFETHEPGLPKVGPFASRLQAELNFERFRRGEPLDFIETASQP